MTSPDSQNNPPTLVNRALTSRRPGRWRIADIIDGRALRVKLTAAALDNMNDAPAARKGALNLLHGAMFRGRLIAQERLQQGADGLDTARLLAAVQDEVCEHARQEPSRRSGGHPPQPRSHCSGRLAPKER